MDKERSYTESLRDLENGRFTIDPGRCNPIFNRLQHFVRRRKGQRSRVNSYQEQQLLSSLQEGMLVRWILEADAAGHAFNHAQLRDMASVVNRASGTG